MSEKMLEIKECMYKFLQEPTRESFIDILKLRINCTR